MSENFEQRLKALEDLVERISAAFIGAPQPATQEMKYHHIEGFKPETNSNVTVQANGWIVTNEFIKDRDLWARINEDLKDHGCKWKSLGKDSHWEKSE